MAPSHSIFLDGPDPKLELQGADVWLPGLYSRRILIFELPPTSSKDKVIDIFRRSLKALVKGTPELGATSAVIPNAAHHDKSKPWRALVPGPGIELVVKDVCDSMPSYHRLAKNGFPLSDFRDAELMPIAGPIMPEPQPVAKFQLNFIEGGLLLSVCIYHHLTDGNGMNTIVRALSSLCKEAAQNAESLPPCVLDTDRSVVASVSSTLTDIKEHPAYSIVPDIFLPGAHHDEAPPEAKGEEPPPPPEFVPHYYFLDHEKAQSLKEYCSRDTPVSTHDAITANLWRALTIARVKSGELKDLGAISTFTVPHNGRKHIGLAKTWIGNCVYFAIAQETVSNIIEADSLPLLAAKIRAALNKIDHDHVAGMLTLRRQDPYSLNWWPIIEAGEAHIVGITSFYHSELVDGDWGPALGRVKHFTCTDLGAFAAEFQRAHFVGPKLDGGRACNVHVGLTKPEVDHFRNDVEWNKYFKLKEVTYDGTE